MKKLILAFLAVGFAFAASAQIRSNFVYDDGTIQSGYFALSTGASGIYWSQGANPTPYIIDSTKRNKNIVAPVIMNSSLTSPKSRNCAVTVAGSGVPAKGVSTSPGLSAPFVLTFGTRTVGGVSVPNTVDISENPVLSLTYSKPLTPASNYYVIGYTDGASDFPTSDPTKIKIFNASTTSFGAGNGVAGSINGGFAASGSNPNNTPLRVTIQVADSAGNKIELASTVGGASYNWSKLGFTMSTLAGTNIPYTVTLTGLAVLDYNTNSYYPQNPFICANGGFGTNGCPAVKGLATVTNTSLFNFKKVAQVLIFLSGGCGGKLEVATTLGICGYGINYTCYDNTLTITSFSLGKVPSSAGVTAPAGYTATFTGANTVTLEYTVPTGNVDTIVVARSVVPNGFWTIVNEISSTAASPFYDGYNVTTATGVVYSTPGAATITTTGTYYYKLGTKYQGKITWDGGYTGTNGLTVTSTGIIDDFISGAAISLAPNPTTGITSVQYSLTKSATISYKVLNSLGSEVVSYTSGYLSPGTYSDPISLVGKTSGLYLVTVFIDGKPAKTEKLILE